MKWRRLNYLRPERSGRRSDPVRLTPRAVLLNDFTVPGAVTSGGDGKNPTPTVSSAERSPKRLRVPAAVLLRSAIQEGKQ
jgi:hypothetical protein